MIKIGNKTKLVFWSLAGIAAWGACYVSGYKIGGTIVDLIEDKQSKEEA